MSDKPIQRGDLVVAVRECCSASGFAGRIRTIARISYGTSFCAYCNREDTGIHASSEDKPFSIGLPIAWLKRIDPPALSEDVPTGEEITA